MKISALSPMLAGLLMTAVAEAAVCDKIYYMQSGTQVILAGPSPAALAQTGRLVVDKSLGGVEVLHPETEYDVVTRFEGKGSCADWKQTTMDFASRKKGSNAFVPTSSDTNWVKLHSTPYSPDTTVGFEYWFGFASSRQGNTVILFEAIGKLRTAAQPHAWFGTATMTQNLRQIGPGGAVTPKGSRTHFFRSLASHPDSAALQALLLKNWKDEKDNDTQTVSFKVQLLKVIYDSIPSVSGIRGGAAKSKPGSFQASQSGKIVFIRPGAGQGIPSEALGLYNMMGYKIATLHPTGYLYQWNGRTALGAEAPTGVYFVQSGARTLGKFFYSR